MDKLIILLLLVVLVGYWVYCLATYDNDDFDEDEKKAKEDLF